MILAIFEVLALRLCTKCNHLLGVYSILWAKNLAFYEPLKYKLNNLTDMWPLAFLIYLYHLPRSKTFLNPSHLFSITCTRLSIRLSISSLSFLYLAEFSLSLLYKELCLLKISCNSFWRLGILSWSGNWAISWILMSNFSPHWIATNFNDKFLSTAWSAGVFLNLWNKYFRNLCLFLQAQKKINGK